MLSVSAEFLAALASSQSVSVRADLLKAGAVIYSGLPVTGGSVEFSRGQIASRRLSCTIAPELPLADYRSEGVYTGSTVGVYGHEVLVWWTLHYPDGGFESVPLGRFRVDQMAGSLADDEQVSLSGSSRESFVADDAFVTPRTISGPSAQSLIVALIRESLGSAQVVVSCSRDAVVPATGVDRDRWEAIRTLAASISATVRCDAYGRFIIADAPTLSTPPVYRLSAGLGGVLVRAGGTLDRSAVRNCQIVQGSAPSGQSDPVQAVVYDADPTSLTRYGDPDAGYFGRIPEVTQISTLTTLDQCRSAAAIRLAQTTGVVSSLDLKAVPNPALDMGDMVDIIPDAANPAGSVRRHIIDSGSIDLTPGGNFSLATRDLMGVQ